MPTTYDLIRTQWLQQLPNPAHRKLAAAIMARTILHVHEQSPACWMVSHFEKPPRINMNVGRAFVFAVHMDRISAILDTALLQEGATLETWSGGRPEDRFKTVPGATWISGPAAEVFERWAMLEPAFQSAVDKAIRSSSGSQWWRSHQQMAVQLISDESGISLPIPRQPARPSGESLELRAMLQQFCRDYPDSEAGRRHIIMNVAAQEVFARQFGEIRQQRAAGADITDRVLRELLPHADNSSNRANGAWITSAPVLNTDIRRVFEPAGRALPEHWPVVADLIMDFFETCAADPGQLEAACRTFADHIPAKGFQSAILSPGLAALNPDAFCIVNKKPLDVLEKVTGTRHTSKLVEYAATNADLLDLVATSREVLDDCEALAVMSPSMRFDMFTHWYVAVRPDPPKPTCWKISPGEGAFNWETCREGGFISMGWEKFGDVSELSREEFDAMAKDLEIQDSEYSSGGTPQLWQFANDIRPGDWVLANKGTSRVLGYGKVSGVYYFEPGVTHGHRLPVNWVEFEPRDADMTGWQRTILEMTQERFDQLVGRSAGVKPMSPPAPPPPPGQCVWMFQANPKLFDLEHQLQVEGFDAIDAWKVAIFKDKMHPGDIALLWQAGKKAGIYAIAELTGPVFEVTADTADDFVEAGGHKVPLRIIRILKEPVTKGRLLEQDTLANLHILKAPFGTNFKVSAEEWAVIEKLIDEGPEGSPYTIEEAVAETGFPAPELQRWLNAITRKGQAVLYGPPGTGKTYIAERLAKLLIADTKGFHELVQFHPAYAYEDFIQGLRPVLTPKGSLDYKLVPGRFLEFCRKAERHTGTCVLILDEINRANLARVFGELMYLLEYRDQAIPLAGGGELRIPANVRIIGTMNTADRSIALVDHALRRRFAFIHLRPQYEVLEKFHKGNGYDPSALVKTLKRLNQTIDDPHYQVGISFFLRKELATHLEDIWRMEIEPYLEEYFFDQAGKAKQFSWDELKKELP